MPSSKSHPPQPSLNASNDSSRVHVLSPKRALGRLLLSAFAGFCVTALLSRSSYTWALRAMLSWDAAAFTMLAQSWILLLQSSPETTERRAAVEDPGRALVLVVAVLSSLFSLFAATLSLRELRTHPEQQSLLPALLAVALSWLLTHTVYAFRYAHLYYRGESNGGLVFPGTERPCDLDFAYYSLTIGMCFQVSDVQVTTSEVRNATLIHAVVSFIFNTTIIAFSISVVSQLLAG